MNLTDIMLFGKSLIGSGGGGSGGATVLKAHDIPTDTVSIGDIAFVKVFDTTPPPEEVIGTTLSVKATTILGNSRYVSGIVYELTESNLIDASGNGTAFIVMTYDDTNVAFIVATQDTILEEHIEIAKGVYIATVENVTYDFAMLTYGA